MSHASEFGDAAKQAKAIYEVVGKSGASYVFFWFSDHSIIASRRLPSQNNLASARFVFGDNTMDALNDCGMTDTEGTTYQKGRALLKRLQS